MSIGLYDMDFMTYTHVPFNLEIMKLGAYFKSKKEVTILTSFLEPERYTKFYLRKDFKDNNFPNPSLLSNINFGGYAFSNNLYIPMDLDVETKYPDKNIYLKYEDQFVTTKTKKRTFSALMNMEHIRISLDNKNINTILEKSINISPNTNILMFHDYNLNDIKDSHLYVKDLFKFITHKKTNISHLLCTKFPIQVNCARDLCKWLDFNFSTFFGIQYNGILEDSALYEIFNNPLNKKLNNRFMYNITSNCVSESYLIQNLLPQIFRQALFIKSRGIKISLTYTDNFFINKKWEKVIDLINLYCAPDHYDKIKKPGYRDFSTTFTLYRYITSPKFHDNDYVPTVEELRELFSLVRVENYELFKMFYEVAQVEYKGGQFYDK